MDCRTKYPILLVHGVHHADERPRPYWGRIPEVLREAGACVYFGGQDSWGTVVQNAAVLSRTIRDILEKENCARVNIIAHSKGGLDSRYLIGALGMGDVIASLTTICTPHRGCTFLDRLARIPKPFWMPIHAVIWVYCRAIGDKTVSFYDVCMELRASTCAAFNARYPDDPQVYYQSYAAVMSRPTSDLLMAVPHLLVRAFDGENDGLVSVSSAMWGEFRGALRATGRKGISHHQMVDYLRRDGEISLPQLYASIADDLRQKGF